MKFYRLTYKPNVAIAGRRRFWLRVIRETSDILIGWELNDDGDRTHRQHVVCKELVKLEIATMDKHYGSMELA
jgi:hypothetical protein